MNTIYFLAVWAHVGTAAFWIGAMFFGDPSSDRFFSRLFERKLGGVGWYAHGVLWPTGIFALYYRGWLQQLFSPDFITSSLGAALWAKIALVVFLLVLQIVIGNRPSKAVFGYVLAAFLILGLSVFVVRSYVF
jgi:hypothetical protein